MARTPRASTSEPKPTPSTSTALTNWDEALAADAVAAVATEASTGGAPAFSIKGGVLMFNDVAIPNNEMAVIVLDSVIENAFYDTDYDPDNITPPTCFAFGRDENTMAPHETVFAHKQAQNETCQGCKFNKFGTADKGRGKACGNRRRMMLIPAGEINKSGDFEPETDSKEIERSISGQLKIPPTSLKLWGNYVKQVAGTMNRPPHGVMTKMKVIPDQKSQFKVTFQLLGKIDNSLMAAVMERRKEALIQIETPYNLDVEEAAEPTPKAERGKPVGRKKY